MKQTLKVSGKKVSAEPESGWSFEVRPGGWCIATAVDGRRIRFSALETRGKVSGSLSGSLFFGEILGVERNSGASHAGGGDSDLTAQFPGKVRKLVAKTGSPVKQGEALLMMEAMKMEFIVKAPFDGVLKSFLVKEEEQVGPGKLLVELIPISVKP